MAKRKKENIEVTRKPGRPRKFESPEQMQEAIDAYFVKQDERKKPYTIMGLAIALDIDRDTLLNYEKKAAYKQFFGTVKGAKARIAEQMEENLLGGDGNKTGLIFSFKNNFGWKDKQEVEQSGPDGGPVQHSHKIENHKVVFEKYSNSDDA